MLSSRLLSSRDLARQLGVPVPWLKTEARAGRLPCLKVGRRFLFNPAAVELALADRAAGERLHPGPDANGGAP